MGGAMLVLSVILTGIAPPIAGPIDPVARVILALAVVLVAAKLGGDIAERLGQPAVLGELLGGILLGNLDLVGLSWVGSIPGDGTIDVLAKLGAVLLLFEVGLESTVGDIMKVGGRAFVDAVLGLVILAVITSIITTANRGAGISYIQLALVFGKAMAFLAGALVVGRALSPRLFALAGRLRGQGVLLITALVLCFLLAYIASVVGLAPIVGAYAAGLVLEEAHYTQLVARSGRSLPELVRPLATFLVPVFFVVMGTRVRLETFAHPEILGLAGLLTVAAILGKQACALGGLGAPLNRLAIGIGMIPRGEVGLIFANLGLGLTLYGAPVVDQGIYSAVVIMVVLTALITPPALTWCFRRAASQTAAARKGIAPVPALAAAALDDGANGAPHRFLWSAYRQAQPWLSASRAGPIARSDGPKKARPAGGARPPARSAE